MHDHIEFSDDWSNCFRDRLGDFASHLWSKIEHESARDDLLRFYKACPHLVKDIVSYSQDQQQYDELRQDYPNNCFSYAAGLIAQGNSPMDPFYLSAFDDQQINLVTNDAYYAEFTPALKNIKSFERAMALRGIIALANIEATELKHYTPAIGMICEKDYHFVKVDLYSDTNEPRIFFAQKGRRTNIVHSDIKQYAELYKDIYGKLYHSPKAFGLPKTLIGRNINVQQTSGKDFEISFES